MSETSIEWTDVTWNPVRGCALVSPGCENCYAMRQARRFSGKGAPYDGLTVLGKHGPRWTGRAVFVPEKLGEPLRWRKSRRIFVNSMSDLFHDDVTDEQIAAVFGVMAACPQHTFQVLTKRPARMLAWFQWVIGQRGRINSPRSVCSQAASHYVGRAWDFALGDRFLWPLPNVWLLVSVEDQPRADERIPLLLRCPAVVHGVSAEPLLGPLNLFDALHDSTCEMSATDYPACTCSKPREVHLDWVIAGGESGPGARGCNIEWIESIVRQCQSASVAVFLKQLGSVPYSGSAALDNLTHKKGGDILEFPKALQVRQFPR